MPIAITPRRFADWPDTAPSSLVRSGSTYGTFWQLLKRKVQRRFPFVRQIES